MFEEEPLLPAYRNTFTALCFTFFSSVSVINALVVVQVGQRHLQELNWLSRMMLKSRLIAGTTFESGAEADLWRDL